jgi:hypothetical protein
LRAVRAAPQFWGNPVPNSSGLVFCLQVPLLAAPMAGITAAPLRLMYTKVMVRRGPSRLHSGNSLTASLFGPACWLTGSRAVSSAHRTCQVDPVGQLQPMFSSASGRLTFILYCMYFLEGLLLCFLSCRIHTPVFVPRRAHPPAAGQTQLSGVTRTAGGRRLSLTDEGQPLYQEVLSARTKVARELHPYTLLYCRPSRVCAGRCAASSE